MSPNIANKVDVQPYLSFEYVLHLAVKVEKRLKGRKSFHTSLAEGPFTYNDIEIPPPQAKALDKGKGITSEPRKRRMEKNALSAIIFGIFKPIVQIEGLYY